MSLILDALNRSRQESDVVPGIGSHHPVTEIPVRTPLVIVTCALMVALVVIGWLIWGRSGTEVPPVVGDAVVVAPAEVERSIAAPAVEPVGNGKEPAVAGLEPDSVAKAAPVPTVNTEKPSASEAARPRKPVPEAVSATDPAVEALYSSPPPSEEGAPVKQQSMPVQNQASASGKQAIAPSQAAIEEETIDVDALLRRAENEQANSQLDPHPAPFLNALSQHAKDAIPTLLYSAHGYSGKPGQSTVVINGQQLKPGGSPAAGVKIEEILPDSVVLSFRGDNFRLRALNSWVNL